MSLEVGKYTQREKIVLQEWKESSIEGKYQNVPSGGWVLSVHGGGWKESVCSGKC